MIASELPEYLTLLEGLERVGIYRRNGSYDDAMLLRRMIDEGRFSQISLTDYDIHTVGELVKMFLLQLPEPLLTYKLARRFMFTTGLKDQPFRIFSALKPIPFSNFLDQ